MSEFAIFTAFIEGLDHDSFAAGIATSEKNHDLARLDAGVNNIDNRTRIENLFSIGDNTVPQRAFDLHPDSFSQAV